MPFDDVASLASYIKPFFTLSYATDTPAEPDSFHDAIYYKTGPLDLCLIIGLIAGMAFVRDALRLGVFEPVARWKLMKDYNAKKNGITIGRANGFANGDGNGHVAPRSRRNEMRQIHRSVLRFAEQGYQLFYYSIVWTFGFYVHCNLPTSVLNPTEVWLNYPHAKLAAPLKFYYLLETAFYSHQILILNAEARRKDHWQMMTHHVVTVFLMAMSYCYNFTRVGCLIMVIMDWCDIFLPLAKMLRYINFAQALCDAIFAFFMVSWAVTRHVLFLLTIKSTVVDSPRYVAFKYDIEAGHFYPYNAYLAFSGSLILLQILQIIWFATICRVAYNVIMGVGASDSRSDDEDFCVSENDKDE